MNSVFRSSLSAAAIAALLVAPAALAQNTTTTPVGVVTVSITAGTGSSKRTSNISLPLLETASLNGKSLGKITSVTASTISDSTAGWTPGELSNPASPKLLQITTGNAAGTLLLLSTTVSNNATTVTIAPTESARVNLTTLGIAVGENGDSYRILECDTISSVFGDPSNGVLGGTSSSNSDNIVVTVNGSPTTYFYKTDASPPRWVRNVLGFPNGNNDPIHPNYGLQYQRLASTNLSLSLTGEVPSTRSRVVVKNSGTTILANPWPVSSTLQSSNIHLMPGWTFGGNTTVADTITIVNSGSPATYFHDGTNWRRSSLGYPISNNATISAGSSVSILKRGSASGFNQISQELPYSLQ